ncbi:spore germination protein, amino acid permease [Halobacteroides halobius DSM 5150]|uniref:Spore germination protein, amino acid permease n=1 Tax=Halobacteroides halobius (strain ATCC 35273 / DSM 5150 / MD-1) TaxID=748449 RepID=L0K6Q3_HALHC|nr:endospore germination permease [Halobacteroides halobius]AGB40049.1 spore germination protein, amino acid permease [Halobacteroides halobius DSM 5150]
MIQIKVPGRVTERQFSAIMINTIIGVGILILPRAAVKFAHTGGTISFLLAAIFSFINLLIVIKLGLRFPERNIFQYMNQIVGRVLSKFISAMILLYWILFIAIGIRAFSELIVTAILPTTPLEVIMISIILLIAYLARKDIQIIGRVNEVYALFLVIPLLILIIMSLKGGKMVHLFPVFRGHSIANLLKGSISSYFSLLGFEVIFIFIPHITTKDLTSKYAFRAWGITTFLMFIIVIVSIAVFGAFELKNLTWPVFELVKSMQFSSLLFERLEVAFVAIWVIAIFTTAANILYGVSIGTAQTLDLGDNKTLVFPLLPILYLIALAPRNAYELFNIIDIISMVGIIITFVIPSILLVVAIIRGKEGRINNEKDS